MSGGEAGASDLTIGSSFDAAGGIDNARPLADLRDSIYGAVRRKVPRPAFSRAQDDISFEDFELPAA